MGAGYGGGRKIEKDMGVYRGKGYTKEYIVFTGLYPVGQSQKVYSYYMVRVVLKLVIIQSIYTPAISVRTFRISIETGR